MSQNLFENEIFKAYLYIVRASGSKEISWQKTIGLTSPGEDLPHSRTHNHLSHHTISGIILYENYSVRKHFIITESWAGLLG